MARLSRLAPVAVVALFAAISSACADGLDASSSKTDASIGFLSRRADLSDDGDSSFGALGLAPGASLGLTPTRSFTLDFDWGDGIRSELRSDFNGSGEAGSSIAREAAGPLQTSLLGNMIYDFAIPETTVGAHLGAGIGIDSARLGFGRADDLLAYQFLAGTEYAWGSDLRVGAEYRFLGTAEFSGAGSLTRYNPGGHSLLFTLRYDWGAATPLRNGAVTPTPAPLLAMPSESQPAAPAPPEHSFEVVFEAGRADLTGPDAAAAIGQAVDAAKAGESVRITVSAPTDTVGTSADNEALSAHRDAAIRQALEAAGIAAGDIAPLAPSPASADRPPAAHAIEIVVR